MKHWIASLGIATVTALAIPPAHATTYYLSDCQTGAAPGCVAGSDAANGTSASTPKRNLSGLPKQVAGDTVSFAKGGSWAFSSNWYPSFGTKDAPLTYNSYQAAWCLSGACLAQKPILSSGINSSLVALTNSGASKHKEGLILRGLDLRSGAGSTDLSSTGIFIYNDSDWITIDSVEISGFGNGVVMQGNSGVGTGSDGINQYITIENSNIHDNLNQGIIGFATDLLIDNNSLDNNGKGVGCSNRCHNLYLGGRGQTPTTSGTRMTVRGNRLTRAAFAGGSTCVGTSLNMHGNGSYVTIENNIVDGSDGASGGCYGIAVVTADPGVPEMMRYVAVRGNKVINVGGTGIGMSGCLDCTIEDNEIVFTDASSHVGIDLPNTLPDDSDATQNRVTVRNNSIYFAQANINGKGIHLDTYGANHVVVSNLVYFDSTRANGYVCFQPGPLSMFDAFDNNLCYDSGAGGRWSVLYPNLAAAQRAGFDLHGMNANPLLVAIPSAANGYSMALKPVSPAAGAGHRTLSAITDIAGGSRGSAPDIGAWQEGGAANAVPPAPPAGVIMQ